MIELSETESDAEKTAFNARAKASMQEYLRSKTWEEKVASIERMNAASKTAREAMKKAMAKEAVDGASNASTRTQEH